jgi:peptide/nickel transport system ATP-binding protein
VTDEQRASTAQRSQLLELSDLRVLFPGADGDAVAVRGASFDVGRGEKVALVGESGSGKSVSALAITRLVEHHGAVIDPGSSVRFDGEEVMTMTRRRLRAFRSTKVGTVFQDPFSSLNPVQPVGHQIAETLRLRGIRGAAATERVHELLREVGIPKVEMSARSYPHEFSGGMRQRLMIALALAAEPELLIADEPTTALDVTVQAQILELLDRLVSDRGLSVLLITHDLGIVAGFADRLHVMYAGEIVESGPTDEVFERPAHPYTRALIASVPQLHHPRDRRLSGIPGVPPRHADDVAGCPFHPRCPHNDGSRCEQEAPAFALHEGAARPVRCHHAGRMSDLPLPEPGVLESALPASSPEPILEITGLVKHFHSHGRVVRAVDGVTFSIPRGRTLGLVGESGSGKSTVARAAMRLIEPTAGTVRLDGAEVTAMNAKSLRASRRSWQMVFQDPRSSMSDRMRVEDILAEPLRIHGLWGNSGWDRDHLVDLLHTVRLGEADLRRYPHEFSGGQRQRIALARALALRPELIVCDEPVSALDVSTQAEVINLLIDVQRELGVSYLFIAHDLSVVRHISHEIAVMYCGRIVEFGSSEEICARPRHPYTQALLSAVPLADPARERTRERIVLLGDVPDPAAPPAGCTFHGRCAHAMAGVCDVETPALLEYDRATTRVACHLHQTGPVLDGAPLVAPDSAAEATPLRQAVQSP